MSDIVDLYAIALELRFINGTIIAIAAEAIQGIHDHSFKPALCAITQEPLELWALVCTARQRTVAVFADNDEIILLRVGIAFAKLAFNGFFALVAAGVTR